MPLERFGENLNQKYPAMLRILGASVIRDVSGIPQNALMFGYVAGASVFYACGITYAKLQRLLPEQSIKGVMPIGTKTVSSPQQAHALW